MKKLIQPLILLFTIVMLTLASCNVKKELAQINSRQKPAWVDQRPTNTMYYIGIGYASKLSTTDFQRVAKKNALDDMMGEIKVTVSSNSILSQYQNNQNFSQQFFSDSRMVASETMEGFEVMDSWENKTDYWIYYRLNKTDFEAYKRKKIREAAEKALDYLNRASQLDAKTAYVQAFQLRTKAAASLQNYLNESIEVDYQNKQVFLLNEIMAQLQAQLFLIRFEANPSTLHAVVGKSLSQPIQASAFIQSKDSIKLPIPYLPVKIVANKQVNIQGSKQSETQQDGSMQFGISRLQSKDMMQVLVLKPDIEKLINGDSIHTSMRNLLLNLEGPTTNIRVQIEPIKIYMQSEELNLNTAMDYPILTPALKKKLMEEGCTFVSTAAEADYTIELKANTKDQGVMWGQMLRSSIDMSIVLKDSKGQNELFRDAKEGLQGFQTTKEKAGVEAYQAMRSDMLNSIYPKLAGTLFSGE